MPKFEDLKVEKIKDSYFLVAAGELEPGFQVARLEHHSDLLELARDDARLILSRDPDLQSERGQALRLLLYIYGRDDAVRLLRAG